MIQKMMVSTAIAVALTFAAQAKEAAKSTSPVTVSTASYQQMPVRDKKGKIKRDKHGKPILKWVRATRVVPGTIVRYIDTVTNQPHGQSPESGGDQKPDQPAPELCRQNRPV